MMIIAPDQDAISQKCMSLSYTSIFSYLLSLPQSPFAYKIAGYLK